MSDRPLSASPTAFKSRIRPAKDEDIDPITPPSPALDGATSAVLPAVSIPTQASPLSGASAPAEDIHTGDPGPRVNERAAPLSDPEPVGSLPFGGPPPRTYVAQYTSAAPRRGRRVVLEQFNTKIPSEVRDMVEQLVNREGESRQEIVARAIVELYARTFEPEASGSNALARNFESA